MMIKLRSYKGEMDLPEYLERAREFHGSFSPGVLLGAFMVDRALEIMEGHELLYAVVETRKCLPDAIQLLTKCSIGNGWLKILDIGKLALTIYDKQELTGARVHLEQRELDRFPLIRAWAMKEKSKKENPLEPLLEEIIRAGRKILGCRRVRVGEVPESLKPYGQPKLCSICNEAYRYGTDKVCQGCIEPYWGLLVERNDLHFNDPGGPLGERGLSDRNQGFEV